MFDFSFRQLCDEDLPLMHRWLNEPGVVRWWEGKAVAWEDVVRDFGSGNTGFAEHWLAFLNGQPQGWIQCYCAKDAEETETYYWKSHLDLERTAGIDYFLGEATARGQGIGSAMIAGFIEEVISTRHPEWRHAAAGPFEANRPSWKALEKAGFERLAVLEDEEGDCVLMARPI